MCKAVFQVTGKTWKNGNLLHTSCTEVECFWGLFWFNIWARRPPRRYNPDRIAPKQSRTRLGVKYRQDQSQAGPSAPELRTREEPVPAFARQLALFIGAQFGEKMRPRAERVPLDGSTNSEIRFSPFAAPCRIFVAGKRRESTGIGRNPQTSAEIVATARDTGQLDDYAVSY